MTGKVSGILPIAAVIAIGLGSMAAGTPPSSVSYSATQAAVGSKLFESKCSACHGEHLEGGAGPALTGATLNTLAKNTKLTIGDAFTFISQQMPLNEPASLTHDQYTSIMAFILQYNGYKTGSKPLTFSDASSSTTIIESFR